MDIAYATHMRCWGGAHTSPTASSKLLALKASTISLTSLSILTKSASVAQWGVSTHDMHRCLCTCVGEKPEFVRPPRKAEQGLVVLGGYQPLDHHQQLPEHGEQLLPCLLWGNWVPQTTEAANGGTPA